jgi:hypothetical protein
MSTHTVAQADIALAVAQAVITHTVAQAVITRGPGSQQLGLKHGPSLRILLPVHHAMRMRVSLFEMLKNCSEKSNIAMPGVGPHPIRVYMYCV